jgi:hypothetical protein
MTINQRVDALRIAKSEKFQWKYKYLRNVAELILQTDILVVGATH